MCNNLQQQFAIVVFALSLYILIRMSLFGNRFAPTDSLSLYQKGNNLKQLLLLSKIVHNSIIQIQMVKNFFALVCVSAQLLFCLPVCFFVTLFVCFSLFHGQFFLPQMLHSGTDFVLQILHPILSGESSDFLNLVTKPRILHRNHTIRY